MIANFLLSQSYRNGYQQALTDIKNWFERHSIALTHVKAYNKKNIEMLLNAMAKNTDVFQKYGDDTEIYFEHEKNKITKVELREEK